MIARHLTKLRARDEITDREEQAIRAAVSDYRECPPGLTYVHAGEELHHSTLLLDGLMSRQKDLSNGQRQITQLHVAGDFADLHSFTLGRLDHDLMMLTPCYLGIVPHQHLKAITEEFPHLTRVFWFSTNLDAAIHREWELSLGRRGALAAMAHLFCELYVRMQIVGLTDGLSYALPLTQEQLGECLGITPVHVNRTLKELRGRGLLEFRSGQVTLIDHAAVQKAADFDPGYLFLERRSR